MKKHTYFAVLPDGRIVTRTTHRTYTHVIIGKHADWYWNSFRRGYEQKFNSSAENHFFVISWAGSPELALKALRAAQKCCMHSRDEDNRKLMYKDVRMIPCALKGGS
jgi:hypothetical protein